MSGWNMEPNSPSMSSGLAKADPNNISNFSSSNQSQGGKDDVYSSDPSIHKNRRVKKMDRSPDRQGSEERKDDRSKNRNFARSRSRSRSRSPPRRDYYRGDRDRGYGRDSGRERRSKIVMPSFSKAMVTKKDFELMQDSRIHPAEVADGYNDYVSKYKREQDYEFYQNHKNDPWFIERYDPSEIYNQKLHQQKHAQFLAKKFEKEVLSEGSPAFEINLNSDKSVDYNQCLTEDGKELALQKAPLFAFDTDQLTLYLKYIPTHISRAALHDKLAESLSGFVHLSMSEPIRHHNFNRFAWVNFESQHDYDQALLKIPSLKIEDFELCCTKSQINKKRVPVRLTPPLPASMIQTDYEICKKLITEVLDPEKEIESTVISQLEAHSELSLQVKLDLALLYLRRVHSYCLYCGEEYEDERMLSTRCGPQHIRHHDQISTEEFDEILQRNQVQGNEMEVSNPEFTSQITQLVGLKSQSSEKWGGSITFLQKYVHAAHSRIQRGPRRLVDPKDEFVLQDTEDYLRDKCLEIQKDKRYQCDFCKKFFVGEDFVIKHIRNKHQDKVDEAYERESTRNWLDRNIQQKLKKEMKQNYYSDENKLFNQPGRKYHSNESSYYFNKGGDNQERGGQFNRGRGRGGFKQYRDLDDPKHNQGKENQEGRELVDYSDLFA